MIQDGTWNDQRSCTGTTATTACPRKGSWRASARAVMVGVLSVLLTTLLLPTITVQAAESSVQSTQMPRQYDIPAGSLDAALKAFSSQSGVMLSTDAQLTRGKTTSGLHGNYTVAQGLSTLLASSALQAVEESAGGYAIKAAPPSAPATGGAVVLPSVKVSGAGIDDTTTEGTGSYATNAVSIGGKTARDLKEIQQSVSVVTQQRIQDENLRTTADALNQVTGITIVQSYAGQNIYSRGFQITSVQTDGGSPSQPFLTGLYSRLPDLAAYDHVEVLRGADGLFAGAGEAGGTVNLVRKRPLDQDQLLFDASGGSWDDYRAQIDATGPLGWEGKVRGRIVAAYENQHYFYDIANQHKFIIFGTMEADLTPSTLLTVGGNFEREDSVPNEQGLPRYSTGADLHLSRSTCFCTDWQSEHIITPEFFLQLHQALGNQWELKLNFTERQQNYDAKYGRELGAVDPAALTGAKYFYNQAVYSPREWLADVTLNGHFDLLGHNQEVVLGSNWQRSEGGYEYGSLPHGALPINVFAWNQASYPNPGAYPYPYSQTAQMGTEQTGVYGTVRSEITTGLHSIVGVRWSNYEYMDPLKYYDQTSGALLSTSNQSYKQSSVWTPYGGLTYDLTKAVALYASYAQIFSPQGQYVTPSGAPLQPVRGNSYEIGAKGSWLGGALTSSVAAYDVQRRHAAEQLAGLSGAFGNFNCCYTDAGQVRSQGIDAELTGQLLPGWQMFTGYTYNINKYTTGNGSQDNTAFMPQTPKHLLKLWSMYQLPGALSAVRLGGGINAQTRNYQTGTASTYNPNTGLFNGPTVPYQYTQGAYVVVNLLGEYHINEHWSAALNLNNVLDKTYYQTIGPSNTNNWYGAPRSFMLTVHAKY